MQIDRYKTLGQTEYQEQEYVLNKMIKRFATYGYQQVQTPVFEHYDLYQTITGTVRTEDMVKVIAPDGSIYVLRPDVTIPITRRAALEANAGQENKRFSYTSSIFRNTGFHEELREQTQAGVENFEGQTTALDAEILALAIHTMQDFGFSHFKLVIGHAGFFKELLRHVAISERETEQLQTLIRAKNVSDIEMFLDKLAISEQSKHAFTQIPLLYGDPRSVIEQASTIASNRSMQDTVDQMLNLLEMLAIYDVESYVSFDLGLINHMNYYSDIIFQGFVEQFGKPVLMGGRYNHLAEQFHQPMPAIGFAFDMDAVFECLRQQTLFPTTRKAIDIQVYYTYAKQKEALTTAQWLRHHGYYVLTAAIEQPPEKPADRTTVLYYQDQKNLLDSGNGAISFSNQSELRNLLKEGT